MTPNTRPSLASNSARVAPRTVNTARGPVELLETGTGPAVFSIHGAMGGYDQSDLLARTVCGPGFHTVAVSRPGYLGTPLGSGRTAEAQADLFAATLDALRIHRVAVMAVSGGGPSAIEFALRHPSRCAALVLISTCSGPMTERIPLAFKMMKALLRHSWFARLMERQASRSIDKSAARSIPDPHLRARTLGHPEAGPLFRELLSSTADRMAQRLIGTDNDIAVTRTKTYELERIASPCLIVHGTADKVVSFGHASSAASRIPGAELLSIENGEHVSIFTYRDEVRARVTSFLFEHLGTP